MRFLYVFPHPDDESFGPALAIAAQRRTGHEVHLLTFTRGGATKQREKLGLTVEEMGRVRLEEMRRMADVLDLDGMTVLDHPDSGLKDLDPRVLERATAKRVEEIRPDVLVTYPVHGVSGHPDHLVTHAVVKRLYCELREQGFGHTRDDAGESDRAPGEVPRRLAFFTLAPAPSGRDDRGLETTPLEEIGCTVEVTPSDIESARRALDCYETYQEVVREADPLGRVGTNVHFELFLEAPADPLPSLTAGL